MCHFEQRLELLLEVAILINFCLGVWLHYKWRFRVDVLWGPRHGTSGLQLLEAQLYFPIGMIIIGQFIKVYQSFLQPMLFLGLFFLQDCYRFLQGKPGRTQSCFCYSCSWGNWILEHAGLKTDLTHRTRVSVIRHKILQCCNWYGSDLQTLEDQAHQVLKKFHDVDPR